MVKAASIVGSARMSISSNLALSLYGLAHLFTYEAEITTLASSQCGYGADRQGGPLKSHVTNDPSSHANKNDLSLFESVGILIG